MEHHLHTSDRPWAMKLDQVSFTYEQSLQADGLPAPPAVKNVTTSLSKGSVHVLVGPNASGKTTLLKLLLGILEPKQGTVHLAGEPMAELSHRRRAQLTSYVPQQTATSFGFTVEQVVTMGRLSMVKNLNVVEQALASQNLEPLRHRSFTELSTGQQQRVLLARALAQVNEQTQAILLDEPVSAMDLSWVHRTMGELVGLAKQGLAVVVVLHDLNLAIRYADVVWLMDQGRLVSCGTWQEVLDPAVLGPVYGIEMALIEHAAVDRPILLAVPDKQKHV